MPRFDPAGTALSGRHSSIMGSSEDCGAGGLTNRLPLPLLLDASILLPIQLDVKAGWPHRLDTELCHGGQARGCGARLLWLSPQLSGGAQNSLTCLSHVFKSASALAFYYNHGIHKVLTFAAATFAYRADPRVTGQTTRRASSRTSSGACWGRRKRCRMCLVRVLSCLGM